jgi:hypothetical protein
MTEAKKTETTTEPEFKEFTPEEKLIDAKYQDELREFKKRMGTRLVTKLESDITMVEEPLWCSWERTETTNVTEPNDPAQPVGEGNFKVTETKVVERGFRGPIITVLLDAIAFAAPYPTDPLGDVRGESALSEVIRQALDATIKIIGLYATSAAMKATAPASSTVSPPAAVPVPPPVNPDDPCGCCVDFNNTQKPGE